MLIGANASGKSTLLKTLARLIRPSGGSVTLDGKPIDKIPARQLAKTVGLLPQSPIVPEGVAVADAVGSPVPFALPDSQGAVSCVKNLQRLVKIPPRLEVLEVFFLLALALGYDFLQDGNEVVQVFQIDIAGQNLIL